MTKDLSAENDKMSLKQDVLPPTRAGWVEHQLRRDLLFGKFSPGERLLAADLAKQYAVSGTPLREALQRLAIDGLIAMTPQRGVRVAPISLREVKEIYELRCLLEPLALRKSLERVDEEWRMRVQDTYERFSRVLKDEQHEAVDAEEANRAFHYALISRCESRWLLNIVCMLFDHCTRYRFLSFNPRGGREALVAEHRAIYEACMHGDNEMAVEALECHIRHTCESLIMLFQTARVQEEED